MGSAQTSGPSPSPGPSATERADLGSEYEQSLGAKLATIEELRVELGKEGIECPGVLAIGAQSAGKSSVLERLTGITFPRGENTCTRVPTIVQLQTDPTIPYAFALVSLDAEFRESNTKRCNTLDEIKEAILQNTEEITQNSKKPISNEPIHIRYKRKSGPVMTLIDLPGITHVDAENETFDIHAETSNIVKEYVKNESMVVLVVIPANDDFGNSEALHIAQSFDKDGSRTIGVVSKCDLVPESSSDVVKKVRMTRDSDVKLALGYIAVRNKGPTEDSIDVNVEEDILFSTHKVLKDLRPHEKGYQTLSKKIVDLQSRRVNHFIPEVRSLVRKRIMFAKNRMKEMGNVPSTNGERRSFLTKELCDISNSIQKFIRAEGANSDTNIAAISFDLAKAFATSVRSSIPDVFCEEYREKLMKRMRETMGYTLPNFISDVTFREEIFKMFLDDNFPLHIETLIHETTGLMEYVFENRIKASDALQGFANLPGALNEEIVRLLQQAKGEATEVVNRILEAEKSQVFTQNKRYMESLNESRTAVEWKRLEESSEKQIAHLQGKNALRDVDHSIFGIKPEGRSSEARDMISDSFMKKLSNNERKDFLEQAVGDLQISIKVYSDILMNRLFDVIPIVVRSILVHNIQESFHVSMQLAFKDENLCELFEEGEKERLERKSLELCLARMTDAERRLRALR